MSLTGYERYWIHRCCRHNIKGYLQDWLNAEDSKRRMKCFMHISIKYAYQRMLHELTTMDERFYKYFDAQNLGRRPTREECETFTVSELIKMLDIIYWTRNYNELENDESVNDDYSEPDEQSTWVHPHTKAIDKIRKLCASLIWSAWSHERIWCPRFGMILILNNKTDVPKVLLVSYIKNGVYCYSFPKGKPNDGETIIFGSLREAIEETGVSGEFFNIYTDQSGKKVINKCPHIGPISKRRSCEHYYVITTTSVEYTALQPQKHEIIDVEWHPVNMIPCCDDCCIRRKLRQDMKINYHMVTLRDVNNKNPVILNILQFLDEKNGNQDASINYFHAHRRCKHDLN